jgi:hypothetical protein
MRTKDVPVSCGSRREGGIREKRKKERVNQKRD